MVKRVRMLSRREMCSQSSRQQEEEGISKRKGQDASRAI
jgi:hypothetical protein